MTIRIWFIIYALFAAVTLTNCSRSVELSGGGSDLEISACAIEGKAVDSTGNILAGAAVRLRPSEYLSGDQIPDNAIKKSGDIFTDSRGFFRFDSIDTGNYVVELDYHDSIGKSFSLSVNINDTLHHLDTDTLELLSTIYGSVELSNDSVDIGVLGLERKTMCDANGKYTIRVPAGKQRLFITPHSSASPVELTVKVKPGETSKLNIQLNSNGSTDMVDSDSLILRRFLDSSDHEDISVDSISSEIYGRIYKLDLAGLSLTNLDFPIEKLSYLRDLDISDNNLSDNINAIYELKRLRRLDLKGNNLTCIPDEIAQLDSLEHLDAGFNEISSVSSAITSLKLETFDISFNKLQIINLSAKLIGWLDDNDHDWRYTQDSE